MPDTFPRASAAAVVISGEIYNRIVQELEDLRATVDDLQRASLQRADPPLMLRENRAGRILSIADVAGVVRFKVVNTTSDDNVVIGHRVVDGAGLDIASVDDDTGVNSADVSIRVVVPHQVGDEVYATRPAGGTDEDYDDGGDAGSQPVAWRELGATGLFYGTLTTLWNPGDGTCNLQPCVGPQDNTALTDSMADPLDPVDVNIRWPINDLPNCLPVDVGEILAYQKLSDGTLVLFDPPQTPNFINKWELSQNVGVDSDHPDAVADQLRAGT